MIKKIYCSVILTGALSGCAVVKKTAEHDLASGFYIQKTAGEQVKVYGDTEQADIRIYRVIEGDNQLFADTLFQTDLYLKEAKSPHPAGVTLVKRTFDLDVLTTPLKWRFAMAGIPPQMNATVNGSIFAGYRTDIYKISYQPDPLRTAVRHVNRVGYSVGLFSGIGNTWLSPSTTGGQLAYEYDGIVWSKGVAGIIGINRLTVGITVGTDHLADGNREVWIYQGKPWIGLSFGLNLN